MTRSVVCTPASVCVLGARLVQVIWSTPYVKNLLISTQRLAIRLARLGCLHNLFVAQLGLLHPSRASPCSPLPEPRPEPAITGISWYVYIAGLVVSVSCMVMITYYRQRWVGHVTGLVHKLASSYTKELS